jgi:dTDP-4-dehydrorhamnose 3,5-epimerase
MNFTKAELKDAWIIEPKLIQDERGFFAETWSAREFEKHGISGEFKQGNVAYNEKAGTLRGLHFQVEPHGENKLVRVVRGSIYDVIIDLRADSPTYKKWQGVELSSKNFREIFVPKGFAHGYQTLEDDTYVSYEVSELYHPSASRGLRWDDPTFAIQWPPVSASAGRIISPKDLANPFFAL